MKTLKPLFFLMCAGLLFCFGCGKTERSSCRSCSQRFSEAAQSENALYYFDNEDESGGVRICYYDKETQTAAPLCGKAECTHDSTECNAYIGTQPMGIGYYAGKVWWIAPDTQNPDNCLYVYSMRKDGGKRKKVFCISDGDPDLFPESGIQVLYADGYVYVQGQCSDIREGEVYFTNLLFRCTLSGKKEILFQEKNKATAVMQIYRGKVYYGLITSGPTSETHPWPAASDFRLLSWNEDGEATELFNGQLDFCPYEFWVTDKEIFLTETGESGNNVYSYDFATGTIGKSFSFCEDMAFYILYTDDGKIVGYTYPDFPNYNEKRIRVTDLNGNELLDVNMPETMAGEDGSMVFGRHFLGSDANNLYYLYEDYVTDPTKITEHLIIYSLNEGQMTEILLEEN